MGNLFVYRPQTVAYVIDCAVLYLDHHLVAMDRLKEIIGFGNEPGREGGLIGMGVGEMAQIAELDGHRPSRSAEEPVDQLRRPCLGGRRSATRRHQLRWHLNHLSAEHTQHDKVWSVDSKYVRRGCGKA